MNDRVKIYIGLALFVVLATFPIWRAFGSAVPAPPDLAKPLRGTKCVEDTTWMIANHPGLLNQWRNAVVRDGEYEYTATDGTHYEMNLTKTCLGCHGDRQKFCDKCHNYADVQPTCWNCHFDPSREVSER